MRAEDMMPVAARPEPGQTSDLELARRVIGQPVTYLSTPALVIDIDKATANIDAMARWLQDKPARLRPHVKVHKIPQLALMQIKAGAVGVATATVWEARAMIAGGVPDVMIANEVIGAGKIAMTAELAVQARFSVLVDDAANARDLAAAAAAAGTTIGLLVDLDVGMHRCGARTPEEAATLGRAIADLPGADFRGVMGYEGMCMNEPDPDRRRELQARAVGFVAACVDALASAGLDCDIVAGGGTGTFNLTGASPVMTELHAGSYVLMDTSHEELIPGFFKPALHIMATVISVHGTEAVLDSGRKAVSAEGAMPAPADPTLTTRFIAEEHLGISAPEGTLSSGDRVPVIPGYAPTTVNLHGVAYVSSGGTVVDVWPVRARHGTADAM
jgi:D-serine deaminase-like pyridoxal phosphate-dependent protein